MKPLLRTWGTCEACGRQAALTYDGRFYKHSVRRARRGFPNPTCRGGGLTPEQTAGVAKSDLVGPGQAPGQRPLPL